jgi:hypothetical protein
MALGHKGSALKADVIKRVQTRIDPIDQALNGTFTPLQRTFAGAILAIVIWVSAAATAAR